MSPEKTTPRESVRHLLLRMNRMSIALVIVLASIMFVGREIIIVKNIILPDLAAQAKIIGRNCTAALTFGDVPAAEEILSSLNTVPNVLAAFIFDKNGALFAGFVKTSQTVEILSSMPEHHNAGIAIGPGMASILEPIQFKGTTIGHVQIRYDIKPIIQRFFLINVTMIILGLLIYATASFLYSRQLRSITDPILHLVETMEGITQDKDYSRRVPIVGPNEVATLADRFNDMVQTTQSWSQEIFSHRENLEKLVEERTRQWQEAIRKLRTELEERRRTENELRRKSEELASVSENLAQALQFEKRFLANVSHEIRTPLNAIIGFSNFALKTDLGPKQQEYLNKIQIAGNSLLAIINDILDFSKIEAGKLELENLDFCLDEVIRNTIAILSHRIHDKGLDFQLEMAADLPTSFVGDRRRLEQVLLNLLGNAVKFTETGAIELRVEQLECVDRRHHVAFSVRDTGIGMTRQEQERLFVPFTQADGSTTRRFGGTGLGLSISKRLVEMMGGKIGAESQSGLGSTFRFTVWFDAGQDRQTNPDKAPRPRESRSEQLPQDQSASLQRILVAEDNDFNRQIAQELLESWGFAVDVAQNGREAVGKILNNPPSHYALVLMDIQMPELDGFAATVEIRQDKRFADLPILAMTANAFPEDKTKASEAGMNDHVAKPIDPASLQQTLRSHMKLFPRSSIDASVSPGIPPIPGIDVQAGKARLGNNQASYARLLLKFLGEAKGMIDELQSLMAAEDHEQIRFKTHSLKGLSGNMGMIEVFKRAELLEKAGKEKDSSAMIRAWEELKASIELACGELIAVREILDRVVAESTSSLPAPARSSGELIESLGRLEEALRKQDFDAVELFASIRVEWEPVLAPFPELEELNRKVLQYSFTEALSSLESLLRSLKKA